MPGAARRGSPDPNRGPWRVALSTLGRETIVSMRARAPTLTPPRARRLLVRRRRETSPAGRGRPRSGRVRADARTPRLSLSRPYPGPLWLEAFARRPWARQRRRQAANHRLLTPRCAMWIVRLIGSVASAGSAGGVVVGRAQPCGSSGAFGSVRLRRPVLTQSIFRLQSTISRLSLTNRLALRMMRTVPRRTKAADARTSLRLGQAASIGHPSRDTLVDQALGARGERRKWGDRRPPRRPPREAWRQFARRSPGSVSHWAGSIRLPGDGFG
jgi:hypothetical protein